MVARGDFQISLVKDSWMTSEGVSQAGFTPSRRASGVRVTISYSGSEALKWANVDLYLLHERTKFGRVTNSGTSLAMKARGAEIFKVPFQAIASGATIEKRQEVVTKYLNRYHGDFDVKGLPTTYHLLRCYGETKSGVPFAFDLGGGAPPALEEDTQCFIATAAFESSGHPAVTELRRVRDELLLPTRAGRAFVKFYYRHSPRIAKWMADRPRVKRATRAILTPLARSTRALSSVRRDGWRSLFQNKL